MAIPTGARQLRRLCAMARQADFGSLAAVMTPRIGLLRQQSVASSGGAFLAS